MQIFHGAIVTCDPQGSVFSYLVEDEGKIIYVGNDLPSIMKDSSSIIELESGALLPAFGDGHIHFSNWSLFNSTFDVRSANNFTDLSNTVRRYAAKERGAKVLIGYGHSMHSVTEKRLITRAEIDDAVEVIPVYLISYYGHSAVANSAAIGMIPPWIRMLPGFNLDTGQIFGEAYQKATELLTMKIPLLKLLKYVLEGADTLAGYGVGMIHAVEGIGLPRDIDIDIVRHVARGSQLNFRLYCQTVKVNKPLKRNLPRIGGCFATALDGCFGAKDAALLQPYADDPESTGTLNYRDEEVAAFVKEANRAEMQIQLHAVGDAAVTQAVGAIEEALEDYPRQDHRHTLIHANLIPNPVLEKIAALGIGVTVQPAQINSSLEPARYLEAILGERAGRNTPIRQMLKMGINVSGGSDGPVNDPDPLEGIYSACNHYNPEQSLNVADALRIYTANVAHSSFDDKERGSLEKGKIADMILLNKNPLDLAPQDLRQLEVEKLILGGKKYMKGKGIGQMIIDSFKNRARAL